MTSKFGYIASMQQHNILLAILCQHMDIKASIFLSLVSAMLFAYALSPVGTPIVFVPALAFAIAYPIRCGAKMLASRPIKFGGVDFAGYDIFAVDQKDDDEMQKSLAQAYRKAIAHNSATLKDKHRDNKNIVLTSLMLFGYIMIMTAVVRLIESPGSWTSFPA